MPAELVNASAVIVAHDVNISIFKPRWLLRQNILSEEELADESVMSPTFVRIPTAAFELLVLPDRIQFRPAPDQPRVQSDLLRVLGGIAGTLPHTPFTAIGLNYDYMIEPASEIDFHDWDQQRFAAPISRSVVGDESSGARFGSYFSFDVLGMRLKADLRPVRVETASGAEDDRPKAPKEAILGKFNFHRDLVQSPPVSEVLEVLGNWDSAATYASQLADEAAR